MYRHGDLLVHQIERPNIRLVKSWVGGEDAILLRGEATGHNHRLQGDFTLYKSNDPGVEVGLGYFEVHTKANLNHEEHGVIDLPTGFYAVVRQREYTPERVVYVRETVVVPAETRQKLKEIAGRLGTLNTGSTGEVFWLATNGPTGGYDWSQFDIGVTKDGQLVTCEQSGCSCNGPEEPTPESSFSLDDEITFVDDWNSDGQEAVAELVTVTDTLYKVLTDDNVTAEEIVGLPNAEIRRAVVELVGYEKVVGQAEVLDESDKHGKLLRVPLENDEDMVLLFVQDPSTDRRYFLRVPPNMKTARQARAWTFGFDAEDFEPLVET